MKKKRNVYKGYCRICGSFDQLTFDHIPPKSCGNKLPIELIIEGQNRIIQNGLKARTICKKCNNELLGLKYDPEIVKLYNSVYPIYKTDFYLVKRIFKESINVKSLTRGLIGHLLAARFLNKQKIYKELQNPLETDSIFFHYRRYVLGETDKIANSTIYYWYYPYETIKINPYFAILPDYFGTGNYPIFGSLIKFFPLAFFILNESSSKSKFTFNTVDLDKNELLIDIRTAIHEDWPEYPDSKGMVLLNSDSFINAKKK